MPSETFFCPYCRRQLTKSPQAYILGEVMADKDSSFIQLGEMAETVTCPNCGGAIDSKKMIAGEYDGTRSGGSSTVGWVAAIVAFFVILSNAGDDFPWWASAICAVLAGILVQTIWEKLRTKKE